MNGTNQSNPFSTRFWTPGNLPFRFEKGCDAEALVDRFLEKKGWMQITGPHGSGKSTLLAVLEAEFRRRGLDVRKMMLNDRNRKIPGDFWRSSELPTVFFVDGFEQLTLPSRLGFLLRLGFSRSLWKNGLLLTNHRPIRFVPILHQTAPQFDVFQNMVEYLVRNEPIVFDKTILRQIFDSAGGNFRTAFFELYDRFERKRFESTRDPV